MTACRHVVLLMAVAAGQLSAAHGSQPPHLRPAAVGREKVGGGVAPARLGSLLIVDEAEFARALSLRQFRVAAPAVRLAAVRLAAQLNVAASEALVGRRVAPAVLADGPMVVARTMSRQPDGRIAASDLYVVAVAGLRGRFKAVAVTPPRAAASEKTDGRIACAPLIGPARAPQLMASAAGSGLPEGVELNAERASLAMPRTGSVELRIFADARADLPANRFLCAAESLRPEGRPLPEAGRARWPVTKRAALLGEQEYLAAVPQRGVPDRAADDRLIFVAAELVAAANHPSAAAIEGRLGGDASLPPEIAIVARDLVIEGDRVRATEFYVTPWPRDLVPTGNMRDFFLDFGNDLGKFDLRGWHCGPVAMPERSPGCPPELCDGLPWNATQGGYGTDRFVMGNNRTTLRWPTSFADLDGRIRVIACTLYEPPLRDPPMRCDIDPFTGKPILDECNGRDDNCNGQIDEGIACSFVQTCPCQPRGCGGITCGSLPDGCGSVISCGPACP